jgi:hypothetical protein
MRDTAAQVAHLRLAGAHQVDPAECDRPVGDLDVDARGHLHRNACDS